MVENNFLHYSYIMGFFVGSLFDPSEPPGAMEINEHALLGHFYTIKIPGLLTFQ